MAWAVLFLVLLNPSELIVAQQTAFITELPAYSSLTDCAASAVNIAMFFFPIAWCSGSSVATALASCICLQLQNSFIASDLIASEIITICGASSSGELSSALDVLTDYCQPAENATAATTTASSPISSLGALESVSTISTFAPSTSANSASPSSKSNDNPSSANLSVSAPSTTTSISPTSTNGSGLSLSDKITISLSIVFGLPGTIAACLAAYYGYLAIKKKQKRKPAQSATVLAPSERRSKATPPQPHH